MNNKIGLKNVSFDRDQKASVLYFQKIGKSYLFKDDNRKNIQNKFSQ